MSNQQIMSVYSLEEDGVPFYIGITKDLRQRIHNHRSEAKYCDTGIYKHFPKDFTFSIVDDSIDPKEWQFWEKYYISLFKTWGLPLLNTHEGGLRLPAKTETKQPRPSRSIPIFCKCKNCNEFFEPKNRYISKYCSQKCYYKARYEKDKIKTAQVKTTKPIQANNIVNSVTTIQLRIIDFNLGIESTLADQKEIISLKRNIEFPIIKKASCSIKFYINNETLRDSIIPVSNIILKTLASINLVSVPINNISINIGQDKKSYCDIFITF